MVEVVVALGLGGLLAYLLNGPLAGASANQPPREKRSKQAARPKPKLTATTKKAPPAPLVSPTASALPAPSPRKSTATVRKFK